MLETMTSNELTQSGTIGTKIKRDSTGPRIRETRC